MLSVQTVLNLILCTDSAAAYNHPHPAVLQHFTVNHSEHEYSRCEMFLDCVTTGQKRHGKAGTQYLDKMWDILKDPLPRGQSVMSVLRL